MTTNSGSVMDYGRQPRVRARWTLVLTIAALAAWPVGSASAAALGCGDNSAGTQDRSSFNADILADTNAHRAGLGLPPLVVDPVLSKAALWKARDLGVRNYFSHEDPIPGGGSRSPWQRLTDCGWDVASAQRAENIAAGQQSGSAFAAAWIASPGHRANIETAAYRYIGIATAYVPGSSYGTYSVQMFSSKPSGVTAATPPAAPTTTQLTLTADGTSTDICPAGATAGSTFAFDPPASTDLAISRTSAGCLRLSAGVNAQAGRTDITYRATNAAGSSANVTLRVEVESSRSLAGIDPSTSGSGAATTLRGSSARLVSKKCRSKSKRCWYATITVRLRTSDGTPVAGQRITLQRRDKAGRAYALAARATDDRGFAVVQQLVRPPARGTSAWLARTWSSVSIAFAGTQNYAGTRASARVRR